MLIIRAKHYVRCLYGSIVHVGPTDLNSFTGEDGSTVKTIIDVVREQENPSKCNLKVSCQGNVHAKTLVLVITRLPV